MEKRGIFIIVSLLIATSVFAQKGVEDGSRYGHGEDSIKCLQNISIYSEYVKTGNYADAYKSWKEVFTDAPLAQSATYINGAKILKALYKSETDADKKAQYSQELIQVYEQRLKYFDQLNKFLKNPIEEYEVKGNYAHDYLTVNNSVDTNKAYSLLRDAVDSGKDKTQYYVLNDLMRVSSAIAKKDESFRDQLLQDYLDCSSYIVSYIDNIEDGQNDLRDAANATKENIDGYFINSGAADCESLQQIYGPKVDEHKTDLNYLNKVISVMSMLECTSSDAYFQAAEYSFDLEPTSKAAQSLGFLYFQQRNDTDKAMEYLDKAIELEQNPKTKANYLYRAAVILNSLDKYTTAKSYLLKAINNNPNLGDAYILLAQLYAGHHKWCDNTALNQCTFYVVLDKLQTAKTVDSAVAEQADKLISTYSEFTPKIEDLFMLSIHKGDKVEVKGWINETTTVR